MMRYCIYFLFAILCLNAKMLDVEVSARSAILMNAETGAVLYEKHAHTPSFPASITKVATALFAFDGKNVDLDRFVQVSPEAVKIKPLKGFDEAPAYWGEVDGTKMNIVKGEVLSMNSLLHGLMLISGNDAANAIADSLASSIPHFVDELNEYIQSLGCSMTKFQNPHGLHHPEHVSTAYDMALIVKRALRVPQFREIFSKVSYQKPATNKHAAAEIQHTSSLLKPGKYYYPKAIGAKSGNHSKALRTLVAAAEHEGRSLIVVLLGCLKSSDRYEDAIRLFERAFSEIRETRLFFTANQLFTHAIEGAKTVLQASLVHDVTISFFPSEEPVCKAFVKWEPLHLPIRKGQKVGAIQIHDQGGRLIQEEALLSKEDVLPTLSFKIKKFFLR